MTDEFLKRNQYTKLDKSQIQDKEKELKRDYRLLKELRSQSGVGWNESEHKLDCETHLWDNLAESFGTKILQFKRKGFPLYDSLGELYHRQIAEGTYNFTCTTGQKPDVTNIASDDDERESNKQVVVDDDDLQMMEDAQGHQRNVEVEHAQMNHRKAEVKHTQGNPQKAGPSSNKPWKAKKIPKKKSDGGLVEVMERFVSLKEKEANNEAKQDFGISKCLAALRSLEGFYESQKPKAYVFFKSSDNRELILNAVEHNDGSALVFLQDEIARLT